MSLCACGHERTMHHDRGTCWGSRDGRVCMSSCREYRPLEPMEMSPEREAAIAEALCELDAKGEPQ